MRMYFTPSMAWSMSPVTMLSLNVPWMTPDAWMVRVSKSFRTLPWNWGISNMFTVKPRETRSAAIACAPCPPPRTAIASLISASRSRQWVVERLQEVLGPLLGWPVQYLCGSSLLDDATAVEEDHGVGDPAGERHLVGDDEQRHPGVGQLPHCLGHPARRL